MTEISRLVPRMVLVQALDLAAVLSFFLFVPLLGATYGAEAVGIYAVVRRVMGVGIPLVTVGLNESMVYSVSSTAKTAALSAGIVGSTGAVLALSLMLLAATSAFDGAAARLMFGEAAHAAYAIAGSAFLAATALAATFGSIARGLGRFSVYAAIQAVAVVLCPFIAIALSGGPFDRVLAAMAATALAAAAAGAVWIASTLPAPDWRSVLRQTRVFIHTALSRLPGIILMSMLPLLIVLLAKESIGLARTGQLAVALSMATAVGGLAAAFGIAALPVLTSLWQSGRRNETLMPVVHALSATTALMLLAASILYAFAETLDAFLFKGASGSPYLFRLTAAVVPFVGIAAIFRYVVDALSAKAINTRLALISSGLAILACAAGLAFVPQHMGEGVFVAAFLGSQAVLIALSAYVAASAGLRLADGAREIAKSALAGLSGGGAVLLIAGDGRSAPALAAAAVAGVAVGFAVLLALRVQWPRALIARMTKAA